MLVNSSEGPPPGVGFVRGGYRFVTIARNRSSGAVQLFCFSREKMEPGMLASKVRAMLDAGEQLAIVALLPGLHRPRNCVMAYYYVLMEEASPAFGRDAGGL